MQGSSSTDGTATVFDVDGLSLSALTEGSVQEAGASRILSVRPEHITLRPVSGSDAAAAPGNTVEGNVLTTLFEGSSVRYWVSAAGRSLSWTTPTPGPARASGPGDAPVRGGQGPRHGG